MMIPMIAVKIPASGSRIQIEMWIPGVLEATPIAPKWMLRCANWTDANHAAV